jgi:probable HAF family extracellular repeat protein
MNHLASIFSSLPPILALAGACFGQTTYTATSASVAIPPEFGANLYGTPVGITADGRSIGSFSTTNNAFPFSILSTCFISDHGNVTVLPTAGLSCFVSGINSKGDFAGFLQQPTANGGNNSAFTYVNGAFTPIPFPSDLIVWQSSAIGIDDNGDIAGNVWIDNSPEGPRGFYVFRCSGSTVTLLPGLSQPSNAQAFSINQNGDIAGQSVPNNATQLGGGVSSNHAVIFSSAGNTVDLGAINPGWMSTASWINNSGQVVGTVWDPAGQGQVMQGFFYDGTQMQVLNINGASYVVPDALSDKGEVVGAYATTPNGGLKAFYYLNGVAVDLTGQVANLPPGISLTLAYYIDSRGRILARATGEGNNAAFLLTPATDPAREHHRE